MDTRITRLAREISGALAFEQPGLSVVVTDNKVLVSGEFDLMPRNGELALMGRLDRFSIRIELPKDFPWGEPRLFEVGGRIPEVADRHVNPDGSCCFGIWEAWVAHNEPVTFDHFMSGPVQNYFFSQHYYEQHDAWPYGEYQHGKRGLLESYAEALDCKAKAETVRYLLRLFSKPWPKGHWRCPCKSGRYLRDCCVSIYREPSVSSKSAKFMKKRFDLHFEK